MAAKKKNSDKEWKEQRLLEESENPQDAIAIEEPSEEETVASETRSIIRKEIRLDLAYKSLKKHRKTYVIPLIVTFVLGCFIMLCIPRYYVVKVMLAPESTNASSGLSGGLGNLASMAGVNLTSMTSQDAIIPMFYPDVIKSTDFIVPLFDITVKTKDGEFEGSLAKYLTKHQKAPFWAKWMAKLKHWIKPEHLGELHPVGNDGREQAIDPFRLNKMQDMLVQLIVGCIDCSVDKKTDVVSLTVKTQDPLVSALLADTVRVHLQEFITDYRTKKARNDLEHYEQLMEEALLDYQQKQVDYASFVDANQNLVLASYQVQETDLENQLQLAYTTYSQLKQQVQLAQAKVMERTPAFTTIQNATVPVKHAGPKRVLTVLELLFLCFVVTSIYILAKDPEVKF